MRRASRSPALRAAACAAAGLAPALVPLAAPIPLLPGLRGVLRRRRAADARAVPGSAGRGRAWRGAAACAPARSPASGRGGCGPGWCRARPCRRTARSWQSRARRRVVRGSGRGGGHSWRGWHTTARISAMRGTGLPGRSFGGAERVARPAEVGAVITFCSLTDDAGECKDYFQESGHSGEVRPQPQPAPAGRARHCPVIGWSSSTFAWVGCDRWLTKGCEGGGSVWARAKNDAAAHPGARRYRRFGW